MMNNYRQTQMNLTLHGLMQFFYMPLLAAALFLQWQWPDRVTLRTLLWLAGVASLPVSFLVALRDPTRSPADRAAGVYLVPR